VAGCLWFGVGRGSAPGGGGGGGGGRRGVETYAAVLKISESMNQSRSR
jgi:hypothetical protein